MSHHLSRFLSNSGCHALIILIISVIGVGCGGQRRTAEEQSASRSIPISLVLEKEIKGRVLGRRINAPAGVAVDRRGTLFLVDRGNNRVIWFNTDLIPLRSIEGTTSRGGSFDQPSAVTIDEDLNVWVADAGNRRLVQYSEYMDFIDEIDLRDDENQLLFGQPGGVAVSNFGEVYVTDTDYDRIAVLNTFGVIDRFLGDFGYPGGSLSEPGAMVIDRHDHLYVCDGGNQRVMLYDDRGGVIREITHETFYEPAAVALDRTGRLWVLDRQTYQISCFSTDGKYVSTVGPTISGLTGSLGYPSGLAFTTEGYIAICDTDNDRLLICRIITEDSE